MYLGYVISSFGISADTSNVEAVNSFPVPKNLKQPCLFVGLGSNDRQFIQSFFQNCQPFVHTHYERCPKCLEFRLPESLDELKDHLIKAPVLVSINL